MLQLVEYALRISEPLVVSLKDEIETRMAKAHYGLSLAYQELGMEKQLMEEYRVLENLDHALAKKLAQTFPQYNFSCRVVKGCP